ncbi:MAG: hypothetical protein ACREH6_12800 [Geminicoccaceae bacterium]
MTSPAVVILTDPARCGLADAQVLVQALLEVQQLNQAGVGASQAFCDHPAAAMQFIDAYTKAYPDLQLQSSDLPPPADLYSMVADGRFGPLRAPAAAPDNARLEEQSRLYPLYVLSLGKPDALMQALQNNGLVKNSIQVVEIAPVDHETSDPVTVAEAVATQPVVNSPWLAEASAASHRDDQELLQPDESAENAPLKLDSADVNLNSVGVDESKFQAHQSESPAAIVDLTPVVPALGGASVSPPAAQEAAAAGASAADLAPQPVPPVTVSPVMVPVEPSAIVPAGPSMATSPIPSPIEVPPATGGAPPDAGAGEPADPPPDGADDQGPAAGGEPSAAPPPTVGGGHIEDEPDDDLPDQSGARAASPSGSGGRSNGGSGPSTSPDAQKTSARASDSHASEAPEDAGGAHDVPSLGDPDGDVHYPPNSSFASDHDLPYGLPGEALLEPGFFDPATTGFDEIVDLHALTRDLPGLAHDPATAHEDLDLVLMRPPEPGGHGASGDPGPNAPLDIAPPHHLEPPAPDHDPGHDATPTTLHDLDI